MPAIAAAGEGEMLAVELILATLMVLAIILIHLVGLATLTRLLRSHSRVMRKVRLLPFTLLLGASVGLIFIHTVEIWLYAAIYLGFGAFSHFEEALYFSTVTYASIGYGDMLLPHDWRIFGAIEGPVGIMMLGWSTAFLVSLLTHWLRREGEPEQKT
jgi:voltage-gated potassium channel